MNRLPICVLLAAATALLGLPSRANAEDEFTEIAAQLEDRAVVMKLPEGVRRVRLRVCNGDGTWSVHTIAHLEGSEGYLKLRLPDGVAESDLEVTASWTDPFPFSFYQGTTSHAAVETDNPAAMAPTLGPQFMEDATQTDPNTEPAVEESDIWKWRDRTLYFFNQYRGLQVINVGDPANPLRLASMRIDSYGEQMYLHPTDDSVVLLTYDPETANGQVLLVAHESTHVLQQRASLPVPGYIVESRLIGTVLYVVSRHSWEDRTTGSDGVVHVSWRSGLSVTKIDLSDPAQPVASPPLQLADGQYHYWGAQVQATPNALLVSTNTYDSARRQSLSTLHVIDISDPSAEPRVTRHLPVEGQVLNKFNMHLAGDILTVVSQVWRGTSDRRRYASVETFDLSRSSPRLAGLEFANDESITATRFAGDLLYVVTFLRVDPLFVVDLSEPARPRLLSELEIPGFSTYLQPLGSDALISVGVEDSRIAVSWFDVSDPTDTKLASRVYIGAEDGWSWTEANWDEKAFGFFPEDGLLLVPYQGSVPGQGWTSGVQLVELGDKELTKRGAFEHEFQARRARVVGEAVVSISGQALKTLDVSDRDNPRLLAELTLAWPADLVHRVGDVLVQLERGPGSWWYSGSPSSPARLHVSPVADPDELLATLELSGGRVAGSFLDGNCLHLAQLQTKSEEVDELSVTTETFTSTIVDLGDPDRPVVVGRATHHSPQSTSRYGGGSDLIGGLLLDGTLVWYPAEQNSYFWFGPFPLSPLQDFAGDLSFPYFPASSRVYTVDISNKAQPQVLAAAELASKDGAWPEGEIRLLGSTIYHGLQNSESLPQPDGSSRWYAQHWLGRLDLSDPAAPAQREHVSLPGTFEHVYATPAGGTTLFTTTSAYLKQPDGSYRHQFAVQALAFDGIDAFLVDELVAPDWSYGPRVFEGRHLVLGSNNYGTAGANGELTVYSWLNSGAFQEGPTLELPSAVHQLGISEQILIAHGNGLSFLDFADPADPDPASVAFPGINFWQRTGLIEIHERQQAYLPLGIFGVQSLDFGGVFGSGMPASPPLPAQDPQPEWLPVPMSMLIATPSNRSLLLGSMADGEDWRFEGQAAPLGYEAWIREALGLAPGDPVPPPTEDSDHDRHSNLWEYFTGTDPGDPRRFATLVVTATVGEGLWTYLTGYLSINPHAASSLTVTGETSGDLVQWDDSPGVTESVASPFHAGVALRLSKPVGSSRAAFLRARLSMETP